MGRADGRKGVVEEKEGEGGGPGEDASDKSENKNGAIGTGLREEEIEDKSNGEGKKAKEASEAIAKAEGGKAHGDSVTEG